MYARFLLGVMKILSNQIVVMVAHFCEYTENHRIIHFKWMNGLYFQRKRGLSLRRVREAGQERNCGVEPLQCLPASNQMGRQTDACGLVKFKACSVQPWLWPASAYPGLEFPGNNSAQGLATRTRQLAVESCHPPVGQIQECVSTVSCLSWDLDIITYEQYAPRKLCSLLGPQFTHLCTRNYIQ